MVRERYRFRYPRRNRDLGEFARKFLDTRHAEFMSELNADGSRISVVGASQTELASSPTFCSTRLLPEAEPDADDTLRAHRRPVFVGAWHGLAFERDKRRSALRFRIGHAATLALVRPPAVNLTLPSASRPLNPKIFDAVTEASPPGLSVPRPVAAR